ncbi:MAG: hypothetical protein ABIK86_01955 [candidate division WOR-3 bacterium]
MSPLLVLSLVLAGLDLGGQIGTVFPSAGLEIQHRAGIGLGVSLGYSLGRNRFELRYGFAELTGPEASPYRLILHNLGGRYTFELLHRPDWGVEAAAGTSLSCLSRTLGSARESGRTPLGHLGLGLVQRLGPTRLNLGFEQAFFVESRAAGTATRLAFTPLPGIHAGVAYVF